MQKKHHQHLKSRKSPPFNSQSKYQEDVAKLASNTVWKKLLKRYPNYNFNNLQTLGLKDLDANFAIDYINRGLRLNKMDERNPNNIQAIDSAKGIKPDGGIFFVKSKIDGFNHIIGALEVKHQGEYDGYTPLSNSDWKKRKGDPKVELKDRPPQAQGNAIERFAKNANAIKSLTSFYDYNPYMVFCEGFDFFLKKDFEIFENKPYADKYKGRDSAILMRLVAGNDWMPLNEIYVNCFQNGAVRSCPATIFAQMPKWTEDEVVEIMLTVIDKTLNHLKNIGEI